MADTIIKVGRFNTAMNIRKTPSVGGEKIGGAFIGDVMEVTGESSGSLAEKFLCGNVYHGTAMIHGWVKKYYDTDGDSLLEEILDPLNIPGVSISVAPEVTFEQALKICRDAINAIP